MTANSADFRGTPNLFSDPTAALPSLRDARPGEDGARNVLRGPGYITLDAGLYQTFNSLGRSTDHVPLGGLFGRFTSTQPPLNETKGGHVMQLALRYEF